MVFNQPTKRSRPLGRRSFLETLAALHNFMPKLSTLAHPRYELIGNTPWNLLQSCEKAFCAVKCALTSAAAVLVYYDPKLPAELSVDALGAIIMHVYPNENRRPIAYASPTLNKHDKRYREIHKITSAITFGPKRFHLYLYSRHFTILSDHKPLERIFGPKTAIPSLARIASLTSGHYTVSIQLQHQFLPSKQNAVAYASSRLSLPSTVNKEDAIYRVEVWFTCYPLRTRR